VVMYSGNHTPCHPLATLLQAARILADRTDIAFCFVGGGSELPTVRQWAERHQLQNIVVLPYQPLSALAASLSAADLHTVVMGDPFVGIIHPCKVYNIRALGIPYLYIGPSESHVTELTPAFAARHGEVEAVAQYVRTAADAAVPGGVLPQGPVFTRDHLLGQVVSVLETAGSPVFAQARGSAARAPQGLTRPS
jgi:colanic acid biosynthesis glycosyl transferase WcaI